MKKIFYAQMLCITAFLFSCKNKNNVEQTIDYDKNCNECKAIVSLNQSEGATFLSAKRDELITLSLSNEVCTDASKWRVIGYGKKVCGGPSALINYKISIDTVSFLAKVKAYTAAEDTYNRKWGLASDCALIGPPSKIDCVNGKIVYLR